MRYRNLILYALVVILAGATTSCRKKKQVASENNRIFFTFENSTFQGSTCNWDLNNFKDGNGFNDFTMTFERITLDANNNVVFTPIQTFAPGQFRADNAVGSLFIPVPKSGDFGMRITIVSESCKACCATSCSPRTGGRPIFEQVVTKWSLFKDDGVFKIKFTTPPKCICPGC